MPRHWRGKQSAAYVRGPKKARKWKPAPACVKHSSRYMNRQSALKAIGFATYQDYLDSALWAGIRERVLKRDHGVCVACGRKAVSVHHVTYSESVLRGQDDTQLVAICRGCHKFTEFDGDTKLTYTTDIARRLSRRSKGERHTRKAVRQRMRPRCKCCQRQYKALGRNDICMGCYKSGRALRFVQQETERQAQFAKTAGSEEPNAHDRKGSNPCQVGIASGAQSTQVSGDPDAGGAMQSVVTTT
jgi:hypothetical protein